MLHADNITIQYGDEHVLDGFSCNIGRGVFACVTGVSGCGKTSLLKAFLGMAPLCRGTIRIDEHVLDEHSCNAIRKKVAYLPQDLALPYDTVAEAAVHILKIGNMRFDQSTRLLLVTNLQRLGLDAELLDKRLCEISGGQRQRMMLAVLALLNRELWLLDEPTAALDIASRDYVIDFLLEQQRQGKTIVAVSHDMWFASQCSVIIRL